jgi:hypothetical protein
VSALEIQYFLTWLRKSPHFTNCIFITLFTRSRHFTLSWEIRIKSTSANFMSTRSIVTLFAYSRPDLQCSLSYSGYPPKTIYAFFLIPIRATWPFLPVLLDFITLLTCGEDYKLRSSSLSMFLQQNVTFLFLCQSRFQVWNFRFFTSISGIAIW